MVWYIKYKVSIEITETLFEVWTLYVDIYKIMIYS